MNLTSANYSSEIDVSPLKLEHKVLLKHAVGALLKHFCALPVLSQGELNSLNCHMNHHGRCAITLDGYQHYYFMAEPSPLGFTLTLQPWTLESIKSFEKAGMGSNGIQAGAFYHACKEGNQNPTVYSGLPEVGRFFVDKSTSDWRGINLYLNDPDNRLEHHACKVGREGVYTIINVNPSMYIHEYWQGCPTIRKPDGTSAITWERRI